MNYFLGLRHSVRKFLDKKITVDKRYLINLWLKDINFKSGLHIQAIYDDSEPFDGDNESFGSFEHCKNYFVLVGPHDMEEQIGYYGEELVLNCQMIGLNTCWVRSTVKHNKIKYEALDNEKLYLVIAFGYGKESGVFHKSKSISEVSNCSSDSPDWFKVGVDAALLAPTGMNRQKFYLEYTGKKVKVKKPENKLEEIDLGIIKYHFELASKKDKNIWE